LAAWTEAAIVTVMTVTAAKLPDRIALRTGAFMRVRWPTSAARVSGAVVFCEAL
jgi:hypothetical protein